jgi:hypothetical protein
MRLQSLTILILLSTTATSVPSLSVKSTTTVSNLATRNATETWTHFTGPAQERNMYVGFAAALAGPGS